MLGGAFLGSGNVLETCACIYWEDAILRKHVEESIRLGSLLYFDRCCIFSLGVFGLDDLLPLGALYNTNSDDLLLYESVIFGVWKNIRGLPLDV